MNKLFTKIASLSIGLALAIGVGVAVGSRSGSGVREAKAEIYTDTLNYAFTGITQTSSYQNFSGRSATNSGHSDAVYSGNACALASSVASPKYIQIRSNSPSGIVTTTSGGDIKTVTLKFSGIQSTAANRVITIYGNTSSYSTGADLRDNSKKGTSLGTLTRSGTNSTPTATGVTGQSTAANGVLTITGSYQYIGIIADGAAYLEYIAITWEKTTSSASITFDNSSAVNLTKPGTLTATRTVTYANLEGTITSESGDTNVCTAALTDLSGNSASGTKTLTITAVGEGTTSVTVKSVTDKVQRSLTVNVTEIKNYYKATKLAHIKDGTRFIVATTSSSLGMGSTSSSSNPSGVSVTITSTTVDGQSVSTIANPSSVTQLTLEKVSGQNYYKLKSGTSYLRGYSSGGNFRSVSFDQTAENYFYYTVSFDVSKTIITNVGNSRYIRYNNASNSKYFGMYQSTTQDAIDVNMYVLSDDYPQSKALSTISGGSATVIIGSDITYQGTYLPADATEEIILKGTAPSGITVGTVIMSNGTFSVSIAADSQMSESDLTLTFKAQTSSEQDVTPLAVSLAVRNYTPTHTKMTDSGDLVSGMHVIIANSTSAKVANTQNQNNISGSNTLFDTDNGTLSNSGGHGREFIIYETIIQVDENTQEAGWIFYSNGKYLYADGSGTNNYLKATSVLAPNCLFDITFSNGQVTVANQVADNKYIGYNSSNNIFVCYGSNSNNIELYYNDNDLTPTNDQLQVDGYEDALLLLDGTIPTTSRPDGTTCKTNGYYARAKDNYSLLEDASLLSADAIERLTDWASANGEIFSSASGTFAPKGSLGILPSIVGNSNSVTIIIVISALSITAIGGYFFLRRRKEK